MSVDPSLLKALAAAVDADPDGVPVRLHLASLLMQSSDAAAALAQYGEVLARDPANLDALAGAADAAEATGDAKRAEGYRRIRAALGDAASPASAAQHATSGDEDAAEGGRRLKVIHAEDRFRPDPDTAPPRVTLADVGGLEEVKRRLNLAFLAPLRNPEIRKAYGKSLRGGLLLYGPPGCGKTFMARAVAGELGAHFFAVGLSDVLDMWLGASEKHLREIFETARRQAPAVVFFDELDALGHKRTHLRAHAPQRNVVNALLAELDGVATDNRQVFVLGATNHPWDVDTALRRPGRFDRMLLVLPPDQPAREAILRYHLRGRPADGVDVAWVGARADEFSGADLAHLCDTATEYAVEDSLADGRIRALTTQDFKRALKEVHPSVRAWFDTARNYAMFANEGGVYDDLLAHLRARNY